MILLQGKERPAIGIAPTLRKIRPPSSLLHAVRREFAHDGIDTPSSSQSAAAFRIPDGTIMDTNARRLLVIIVNAN